MKIKWLRLQNFRGFEEVEFSFDEKFNVLVGENGSGKTSLLEGITFALSEYIHKLSKTEHRWLSQNDSRLFPNDVRLVPYLHGEITTLEPQFPLVVECKVVFKNASNHDLELHWTRKVQNAQFEGVSNHSVAALVEEEHKQIQSGATNILPIFAYYSTKRLWAIKKDDTTKPFEPVSRLAGYYDYLEPTAGEETFKRWFIQMSIAEIKRQKELKVLSSVRRAVKKCLELVGYTSLDYEPLTNEILALKTDDTRLPFHLLSDGYRNMIGMVADIAYRMALLNPFLDNHLETPGVILIDELDLHLHPKWQRSIVQDLKEAFPNVQFIVTTHSPFIVQSLSPGELRKLGEGTDDGIEEIEPARYVNKSLEDVSTNIMGIQHPQRNEKLQRLHDVTKQYYAVIKQSLESPQKKQQLQDQIDSLKVQIDELSALFSDNVAYHAILELEREQLERKYNRETD
jgi:predicted ATP-binding protein involved in virulence